MMSSSNMEIVEVTERREVVTPETVGGEETFSVVSYNILADCWVLPDWSGKCRKLAA